MNYEYQNADDEGIPWDHGYQGATTDSWDLVYDVYGEISDNEKILNEVWSHIRDTAWAVKNGWALTLDEEMSQAWDKFVETIRFRKRFVYWAQRRHPNGSEMFGPGALLHSVEETLDELGLIAAIPGGLRLARARPATNGYKSWKAKDLGTPPKGMGKSNRFSPAGIGYFYGSESQANALQELAGYSSGMRACVGAFDIVGPGRVVDLTRLPEVPSVFNAEIGHLQRDIKFLLKFVQEMSKPFESRDEVDYVPTQVVAEYLMRGVDRHEPIIGLKYRSAVDAQVTCWVIDIAHENCLDSDSLSVTKPESISAVLTGRPVIRHLPSKRLYNKLTPLLVTLGTLTVSTALAACSSVTKRQRAR